MRIAGIVKDSIVDGEGIRDVVFLQGCCHRCKGCHNKETWEYNGGITVTPKYLIDKLSKSSNDITISGGEPLLQFTQLMNFVELVRLYTKKRVWLYTGFKFEDVPTSMWMALSQYVDVVVDGAFECDKKDKNLLFRGSSNQRIIDLRKSLGKESVVEWELE